MRQTRHLGKRLPRGYRDVNLGNASVVDAFVRLHKAACDGVQVNFYDHLPDLEVFGARIVPLMKQAGLRAD